MQKKTVVFIVNPISGKGRHRNIEDIIARNLDFSRFSFRVVVTGYASHARELAREAVSSGADIVAAVGGDGTVNEVAGVVAGTESTLAIVPCGSGNGLARHLGIPLDTAKAVRAVNSLNTERIDYGTVNGRPFFCTCGMGLDARVSDRFSRSGRRGFLSYARCVLKEWRLYKGESYSLKCGEGPADVIDALLLTVANASQWGNNAVIAPGASVNDGLLDVAAIKPFSFIKAPGLVWKLFRGKLKDGKSGYISRTLEEFSIIRSQGGFIHVDGEPVWEEPVLFFRVCRSGLLILR